MEAQRPSACCTRPGAYVEIEDTGVMTDLLNGNATAAVMGLGAYLKPSRVRKQLRLILERNLQPENFAVINGSYPDGHFLDGYPFMQWQTPWSGTEYYLALQLYEAGLVREGDAVVDVVYQRHVRQGMRFDHCECNNHYARPLSIWGAYAARLGLDIDGFRAELTADLPGRLRKYSGVLMTGTATGWLDFAAKSSRTTAEIGILSGTLPLKAITLGYSGTRRRLRVRRDGKAVKASVEVDAGRGRVVLSRKLVLKRGERFAVSIG
jgi:hypothetical protein